MVCSMVGAAEVFTGVCATGVSEVRGRERVDFIGVVAVTTWAWAGALAWAFWAELIASAVGAAGRTLAVTASGFAIESPRLKVGCAIVWAIAAGRA